jgi:hypothetical protein
MRLGDDIDDHCSRCKRTTDRPIVSMLVLLSPIAGAQGEVEVGEKKARFRPTTTESAPKN